MQFLAFYMVAPDKGCKMFQFPLQVLLPLVMYMYVDFQQLQALGGFCQVVQISPGSWQGLLR
jgi:hypothetical protein